MNKRLFVFGGESTGRELFEIANSFFSEYNDVRLIFIKSGFVEDNELDRLISANDGWKNEYIIGVVDVNVRALCLAEINRFSNISLVNILHPKAYIADSVQLGSGIYVAAGAVISSQAQIGDFCHINYNVSVGHHSKLSTGVALLPGSRISGNVKLGQNVLVGSNAVVFQSVTIGDNSLIDALAYVKNDVAPDSIAFGNKAKVIKRVI